MHISAGPCELDPVAATVNPAAGADPVMAGRCGKQKYEPMHFLGKSLVLVDGAISNTPAGKFHGLFIVHCFDL